MRRILFAVALVAIPFPYAVVEGGRVPAAWLVAVASTVAVAAFTQGGAISAVIARYFLLEALAVVGGAYVIARAAAWLVRRIVSPGRQGIAVAVAAAVGMGVALLPIFRTTAVRAGAPTNLIGIFGLW